MAEPGSPGDRILIKTLTRKIFDLERVIGILVRENAALRMKLAERDSGERLAVGVRS